MNELRIGDVLKESFITYKAKWKTLLMLSLISTIISALFNTFSIILNSYRESQPQWLYLIILVNLMIKLVGIYIYSRIYVSMILVTYRSMNNEAVTATQSYENAKDLTWRYIQSAILRSLMLLIPMTMVLTGFSIVQTVEFSSLMSWFLILVGTLISLYLGTTYYTVLFVAVLHPKESSAFSFSKHLVQGYFFKVLCVALISLIFVLPMNLLVFFLNLNALSLGTHILYSFLIILPSILYAPFLIIMAVLTTTKLTKLKEAEVI